MRSGFKVFIYIAVIGVIFSSRNILALQDNVSEFLPYELLGTVEGKFSSAFICDRFAGSQKIYKLNDLIGDYRIIKIGRGKVTLEHNAYRQVLYLA